MTEIKIPLSKKKNLLMLMGAAMFVILGVFFVARPETFASPFHRNITLIRFVGMLSVIFFGACTVYGMIKLFDKKYGLIIDTDGITDNTNASSVGLINWADISSIETQQVMSTKFLLIFITNPDKYLNRTTGLKRKLLQANMRMYGTPLSIISNSIRCNFDDLEKSITSNLKEFRKITP
ncbi:MAG TPA: STM3941 family protein [Mucilaginibacter sp.]|jgi:hypothetical protein